MSERVAILIDGNNMSHGSRRHGVVVDYGTLLLWAGQGGPRKPNGCKAIRGLVYPRHIVMARVYLGPSRNGNDRRESFVALMAEIGFEVVISAEEGNSRKTAVDRDVMLDALALAYGGKVDRVLLLSGDGGFTRMVDTLKALGVQVEVCAFPDVSAALRRSADQFWDLTLLLGATMMRGELAEGDS
jgi:uncharacterized LabA/DUF88 family protein